MTLVVYVVVTALVATGLFFGIRYFVRAYVRYRDSRLIICPENGEAAMVEVDAELERSHVRGRRENQRRIQMWRADSDAAETRGSQGETDRREGQLIASPVWGCD